MGNSRYDYTASTSYAKATATRSANDYRNTYDAQIDLKYDPVQIKLRESVKSELNPNPTPIIVGLDVTGSMGRVVEACRKGLDTLFSQIIKREPVSDPQVLAMAIGDMDFDRSPVQATQFESDPVTIGKQIEELYLERGGGGNSFESYLGPLYFALNKTKCDAFDQGRKGFLFTVGDEYPQKVLTRRQVTKFFGDNIQSDITAEELVKQVAKNWEYFHLIAMEGSHARSYSTETVGRWTDLLGQRAIKLTDHTKMAPVITSLIEVTSGRAPEEIKDSWESDVSGVISDALKNLEKVPVVDL